MINNSNKPGFKTAVARAGWLVVLLLAAQLGWAAENIRSRSQTIYSVLREPLPPEELSFSNRGTEFEIAGPTFTYRVSKATGAISGVRVIRDGHEVISQTGPAEIMLDDYRLSSKLNSSHVSVLSTGKDKIVLKAMGGLRQPGKRGPDLDYSILHTFFNDGVVVSSVKLIPRADFPVRKGITYELSARGEFNNYLHKRRDEHGQEAVRGNLPGSGKAVQFSTLTSCLSAFSPTAALAIFTDGGAIHLSRTNLETASIETLREFGETKNISLAQRIVHVAPGDAPFILKAGEEFSFRVGISVAPNRLPHPRMHDMRMFIWIGDAKYPYPSDEEITQVAQWGYTLFQMHRGGTAGEPRPPAGELERVIRKVHELGMLFVWTENADLLYASAPGVQELQAKGQWSRWQGFNYDGRYTATMDPYCDLIATCLASPNGLAEYRLANIERMMDRQAVDGIYLDDNLAYPNCTLQKEHGHPRPVYDCLIELHEMNWRRRELLRRRNPHAVLISHCTKAFVLPVIADFDALLYGEGYSFDSTEDYWKNYAAHLQSLHAQGVLYPGGLDAVRCPAALAYNYDLLSGGGQYCQVDWRLFPVKFPYGAGVTANERAYCQTYNLAQFYFGLHESEAFYFANSGKVFVTTAKQTYASLYHNRTWNEWLIPVVNMAAQTQTTSMLIQSPETLGIQAREEYLLFDVHRRSAQTVGGNSINIALRDLTIPGQNLQLLTLRKEPARGPFHVWGGKRISETWDAQKRKLVLELHGPTGLRDTVFIRAGKSGIQQIEVARQPATFYFDSTNALAHGEVTFTAQPLKIEVFCSSSAAGQLPEKSVAPDALIQEISTSGK